MKMLFCCEFFHPSVGGVQEVMLQVAERMVARGHDVTVATTALGDRVSDRYRGISIRGFGVSGNLVNGLMGDVDAYQKFVLNSGFDVVLIKAAQQWTFDALWPVFENIHCRKVFIPCGFSALYDPDYREYFGRIPKVLRQFDALIFYARSYRDIDLARAHGISGFSIIPNGADERSFGDASAAGRLRERLGITADTFLLSTVGSWSEMKGHRFVLDAFERVQPRERDVALVLNGAPVSVRPHSTRSSLAGRRLTRVMSRCVDIVHSEGVGGLVKRARNRLSNARPLEERLRDRCTVVSSPPRKMAMTSQLERADVIQLFKESDLFVFASRIEYSPLVLFEAAAAATPVLSSPVGNAAEILEWTQGGWLVDGAVDDRGYTTINVEDLAAKMQALIDAPEELRVVGLRARQRWKDSFTWEKIALQYEQVLVGSSVVA